MAPPPASQFDSFVTAQGRVETATGSAAGGSIAAPPPCLQKGVPMRLLAGVLCFLALAVAAGCGGDDDDQAAAPPATSADTTAADACATDQLDTVSAGK